MKTLFTLITCLFLSFSASAKMVNMDCQVSAVGTSKIERFSFIGDWDGGIPSEIVYRVKMISENSGSEVTNISKITEGKKFNSIIFKMTHPNGTKLSLKFRWYK